jgi:hypothetical protein
MADSPVFDRVCAEVERATSLDRLTTRGTLRIACKGAGLDPASIDGLQMQVLLRRVLPSELQTRGVADAAALCERIAVAVAGVAASSAAPDRAAAAASTIARFGSDS